jgi:flagellar biosynthesis protein FlhF
MLLKTYFASSVEAAIVQALEDLGSDAMIVNSRRTSLENKSLGEYEVVFGLPSDSNAGAQVETSVRAGSETAAAALAERPVPVPEDPAVDRSSGHRDESVRRLNQEVQRLARQIESLGRVLRRGTNDTLSNSFGQEGADALDAALEAGFTEEFVMTSLEQASGPRNASGSLRFLLMQRWARELRTASALGKAGHGRKVVALVGPAGVGKSSIIAKLAAQYGVAGRRSCQILSLDSDRVGAPEPLRMVAAVLGVGFQLIEEGMLGNVLGQHEKKNLVFVDTPGLARDEAAAAEQLALTFSRLAEVDIHLTLPATMKPRDLDRTIQLFEVFRPSHFLFTRLDETVQLGSIVESALKWDRSLSFLSTGPRIPEDFAPADATQLVRRAFLLQGIPGNGGVKQSLAQSARA